MKATKENFLKAAVQQQFSTQRKRRGEKEKRESEIRKEEKRWGNEIRREGEREREKRKKN